MSNCEHKTWRYALVQHPMWLIIAEDSVCAERTPPWGCSSVEEYAERIQLSLTAVERLQSLHLSFDFSALELEDLADRYPEMLRRIRRLVEAGRISFLNGAYSQPHFQIISVESAIRQFESGVRSIERLTGYRVTCYASQEPGLSPQLPQILRAMGYTSAVTPDFPFGIRVEGGVVQHWHRRWEWLQDDDIVDWTALDGTSIPLWLKSSGEPDASVLDDDAQHGLLNRTRLRVDVPDMIQVDPEWVTEREKTCEFVSLDRELEKLARERCHRPAAWVDANYAYIEGVDAEALSRANTAAESALLSIEALNALLPVQVEGLDLNEAWAILLSCQHHDAYWIGAPELRAKSISRLEALTRRLELELDSLAQSLSKATGCGDAVMVLRAYPRPCRAVMRVRTNKPLAGLIDANGQEVPVQLLDDVKGGEYAFAVESSGLGYHVLDAAPDPQGRTVGWEPMTERQMFANDYYAAEVSPDGRVTSLHAGPGQARFAGNEWTYRVDSLDTMPMGTYRGRFVQGPVASVYETRSVDGAFGMTSRLLLYHGLPWFEVEMDLDFANPVEIGDFFDDRTKLHFAWDVGRESTVSHALGGCPASARPGKTFYANPWARAARDGQGLAFCLYNTTKCWLDDNGRLRFVVAWGHDGDHFHNRQGPLSDIMGPLGWAKPMDLRLRGRHTVRYAVWPHGPGIGDAEVADWALSLTMPPRAYSVQPGQGSLPREMTVIGLSTPEVLPISVGQVDGHVRLRMMETAGRTASVELSGECGWRIESLRNLDTRQVDKIAPHKIVEAVLTLDEPDQHQASQKE